MLFVQQNPIAIEAGAFHNDVVAVGNLNVLLYHAAAFSDSEDTVHQIRSWFEASGGSCYLIETPDSQVPLADAVSSYLFNSQLVQLPDQTMALVAPGGIAGQFSHARVFGRASRSKYADSAGTLC